MINPKYYQDIKDFPSQFKKGIALAKDLKIDGNFNKVMVCGMGGSAFYVELINDYFNSKGITLRLEANRGYKLPSNADDRTLYIIASSSGNTEETLEALEAIQAKGYKYLVITSGGKLLEIAKSNNTPYIQIPTGIQPRLSSGHFIAGLIKFLSNCGLIDILDQDLISIAGRIDESLDEERAKKLASDLKNKVPICYSTDENISIAKVSKIKFNENSKTQSFYNFFPELNHNEMVGFTKMVMNPLFIVFQSKFTHPRNLKRISIFKKLMEEKGAQVDIFEMWGESIFEEILTAYYFIDHVTYYLAEAYGIDPEPVDMVEDFKKMLIE